MDTYRPLLASSRGLDRTLTEYPVIVNLLELRDEIERTERTKRLEALVERIEQLTRREDWSGARRELDIALREYPVIVNLLELRDEIERTERTKRLEALVERIEQLTRREDWSGARRELEIALPLLYPAVPGLLEMRDDIKRSERVKWAEARLRAIGHVTSIGEWTTEAHHVLNFLSPNDPDRVPLERAYLRELRCQIGRDENWQHFIARLRRIDQPMNYWEFGEALREILDYERGHTDISTF